MQAAYRIYGTVKGIPAEALARLRAELPFDSVGYTNGLLDIDHEGPWVDVDAALDLLVAVMEEGGWGGLDVIDNLEWQITRYTLRPGGYSSKSFDLDNVMDSVRPN
ncbi:hypothetical protein dsx2_2590 [Desulfovibrio sp. X2]|uniref:hypothetical protein n=1 Tax=Desulfovibrio sp. X2 TaxID=941449 RepID=UPI000358E233|nr:hypothetical protein [Desulfovibrio sp. X2]EPR42673.1 hypothetical protein dsx2_2590 [Desulfovibrio sp. X2]